MTRCGIFYEVRIIAKYSLENAMTSLLYQADFRFLLLLSVLANRSIRILKFLVIRVIHPCTKFILWDSFMFKETPFLDTQIEIILLHNSVYCYEEEICPSPLCPIF